MPDWLTDSLTTLKDRATQLLKKYKSGVLVTQILPHDSSLKLLKSTCFQRSVTLLWAREARSWGVHTMQYDTRRPNVDTWPKIYILFWLDCLVFLCSKISKLGSIFTYIYILTPGIVNSYIKGGFFNWSALKMTKCQITCKSLQKSSKCQNFLRVWNLVIFRADQLKKPPCICFGRCWSRSRRISMFIICFGHRVFQFKTWMSDIPKKFTTTFSANAYLKGLSTNLTRFVQFCHN